MKRFTDCLKVVVDRGTERVDTCKVSSPAMARHMAAFFNTKYPREKGFDTQMIFAFQPTE